MRRAYVAELPSLAVVLGGTVILALFVTTVPREFALVFWLPGLFMLLIVGRLVYGYLSDWAEEQEIGEPETPDLSARELIQWTQSPDS